MEGFGKIFRERRVVVCEGISEEGSKRDDYFMERMVYK